MTFDELYRHLEKFVHYLAHTRANGAFLMDHDEISGELFEEMVKGYQRYSHLPEDQLIKVVKTMMDYRILELTYRFYKTHRKGALNPLDLQDIDHGSHPPIRSVIWTSHENSCNVEHLLDSRERVKKTFDTLSEDSRKVLSALLYGSPEITTQIGLSGIRSSYVYKTPNRPIKIKPWQVAEALHMEEKVVKKSFREIEEVYAEVRYGV